MTNLNQLDTQRSSTKLLIILVIFSGMEFASQISPALLMGSRALAW